LERRSTYTDARLAPRRPWGLGVGSIRAVVGGKWGILRSGREELVGIYPVGYRTHLLLGDSSAASNLQRIENGVPADALMIGNVSQDSVQRADAECFVGGNRDAVRSWPFGLQDDVATGLVHLLIAPVAAKGGGEIAAAYVAGEFHPRASISSRTR